MLIYKHSLKLTIMKTKNHLLDGDPVIGGLIVDIIFIITIVIIGLIFINRI